VRSNSTQIVVGGPADLRTVNDIQTELKRAFAGATTVRLAIAAAEDVDISFVQLIESARRFAASESKSIALSAAASGALRSILERGGFLATAADRGFWLGETGEA